MHAEHIQAKVNFGKGAPAQSATKDDIIKHEGVREVETPLQDSRVPSDLGQQWLRCRFRPGRRRPREVPAEP
eukprot:2274783-Alexandrium_andersonii.AAC.1